MEGQIRSAISNQEGERGRHWAFYSHIKSVSVLVYLFESFFSFYIPTTISLPSSLPAPPHHHFHVTQPRNPLLRQDKVSLEESISLASS